MIEHTPDNAPPRPPQPCGVWVKMEDDDVLRGRFKQVPHDCGNPKCPGNINRRKLEAWDMLMGTLDRLWATRVTNENMLNDVLCAVVRARRVAGAEEVAGEH